MLRYYHSAPLLLVWDYAILPIVHSLGSRGTRGDRLKAIFPVWYPFRFYPFPFISPPAGNVMKRYFSEKAQLQAIWTVVDWVAPCTVTLHPGNKRNKVVNSTIFQYYRNFWINSRSSARLQGVLQTILNWIHNVYCITNIFREQNLEPQRERERDIIQTQSLSELSPGICSVPL